MLLSKYLNRFSVYCVAMMKKAILLIVLCMAAVFLSGCIGSTDDAEAAGTDEILNYATFLELLEANGFSFEEKPVEFGLRRFVLIGDEQLTILDFWSNEAMEEHVNRIGLDGFSFGCPENLMISWVGPPHWFKRDLIIVHYVGENKQIIDFLTKNLDLFAGMGFITGPLEPSVRVTIEDPIDDPYSVFPPAFDFFYRDEFHIYYLSCLRSKWVMLTFEDGERISLRDALAQEKISIEDLILNGLRVGRMPHFHSPYLNI